MEAFGCFALKPISSTFGSKLLIFFLKIFHLELPCALQKSELLHSEGIVGLPQSRAWVDILVTLG